LQQTRISNKLQWCALFFHGATQHSAGLHTSSESAPCLCRAKLQDANKKQQQSNADKGTKFSTLVGEGAGIFLGEKVGKALGDGVGMAGEVHHVSPGQQQFDR
jgi:hypothetical protein